MALGATVPTVWSKVMSIVFGLAIVAEITRGSTVVPLVPETGRLACGAPVAGLPDAR